MFRVSTSIIAAVKWGRFPMAYVLATVSSLSTMSLLVPLHPLSSQSVRLERLATTSTARLGDLDSIADASSDGRGHIVILDRRRGRLIIVDHSLIVTGISPWKNGGTTRLWEPVALAALGDGRVAAIDRATHRITEFVVNARGTALSVARTYSLPLRAVEGMCAMSADRLVVYGYEKGKRLHLIEARTGKVLRSFASANAQRSVKAQEVTSQGRIACDQARDEVTLSTRWLEEVESFRVSDGARTWSSSLRPFRPILLTDKGKSVSIMSGPSGYSDVATVILGGDIRMFQSTIAGRRDGVQADTVITYLFSRSLNKWLQPQLELPIVVPVNPQLVLSQSRGARVEVRLDRLSLDASKNQGGNKAQ